MSTWLTFIYCMWKLKIYGICHPEFTRCTFTILIKNTSSWPLNFYLYKIWLLDSNGDKLHIHKRTGFFNLKHSFIVWGYCYKVLQLMASTIYSAYKICELSLQVHHPELPDKWTWLLADKQLLDPRSILSMMNNTYNRFQTKSEFSKKFAQRQLLDPRTISNMLNSTYNRFQTKFEFSKTVQRQGNDDVYCFLAFCVYLWNLVYLK